MCTITALANMTYSIIAPFVPLELERKQISLTWIGWIFSAYSFAVIIVSPIVGSLIKCAGRRNLLTGSTVLMGVSMLVIGILTYTDNKSVYISVSVFNRLV